MGYHWIKRTTHILLCQGGTAMVRVAMLQTRVTGSVDDNLNRAGEAVAAAATGADVAVLPEIFVCPYASETFGKYATPRGGKVWSALSGFAKENNITLVAGSIPECDGPAIYNTSFVFGRDGRELAFHRKAHLFDIAVKGGQHFRESDTLAAGNRVTVFDVPACGGQPGFRAGLCICYDARFPELVLSMALQGAHVIFVPAAFNMTTGPLHWHLTMRTRALDAQVYLIAVSPARDTSAGYVSYAHSMAVSPWGEVLLELGADEGAGTVGLDMALVDSVREQLSLLKHRRPALYTTRQ
jgi:predicted amidohydrolase